MHTYLLNKFAPIILTLLFSLLFLTKINLITADLGRHIKNGELFFTSNREAMLHTNYYSYTVPNFEFVNHHWLSGVVFYLIYSLGSFNLLSMFAGILSGITFYLLFSWSQKNNGTWTTLALAPFFIVLLVLRKEIRPELFSMFFTVLFLLRLLKNWEKLNYLDYLFLGFVQLLWVNLHIFFIFSIVIVGAFILHAAVNSHRESVVKLIALLGVLTIISLLNPYGLKGFLQPFKIFNNYEIQPVENLPLVASLQLLDLKIILLPIFMILALSALLFVKSIQSKKVKQHFHLLVLFLWSFLISLMVNRMLSFFVIFSFIYIAQLLPLLNGLTYRMLKFKPIIVYIVFLFVFVKLSTNSFGVGLIENNQDSYEFFTTHNLKGPIFNNFDIGSYLIFNLPSAEKVFIDNRSEAYPAQFIKDEYLSLTNNVDNWKTLESKYNFNVVYLHRNFAADSFVKKLLELDWKLVYFDQEVTLLLKDNSTNLQTIKEHTVLSPEFVQ